MKPVTCDADNDGKQDVFVSDFINDRMSLFLGLGDGTLASPSVAFDGHEAEAPTCVDVNGDGNRDLLFPSQGSGFGVALADGLGGFAAPTFPGGGAFDLAVADFNGDNKLDVAFASISANNFTIALGN